MKAFALLLVSVAIGLFSNPTVDAQGGDDDTPIAGSARSPANSPIPARNRSPQPAPSSDPLAARSESPAQVPPLKTYWLVEYVAVPTPSGITGLVPGQRVRCLGIDEQSGLLIVTDGTCRAKVDPVKLTADPGLGRREQERDQAIQDAQWSAGQKAWEQHQNQDKLHAIDEAARVQAVSSGLVNSVSDPLVDPSPLVAGVPDALKRGDLLLDSLYGENLRTVRRQPGSGHTAAYEPGIEYRDGPSGCHHGGCGGLVYRRHPRDVIFLQSIGGGDDYSRSQND